MRPETCRRLAVLATSMAVLSFCPPAARADGATLFRETLGAVVEGAGGTPPSLGGGHAEALSDEAGRAVRIFMAAGEGDIPGEVRRFLSSVDPSLKTGASRSFEGAAPAASRIRQVFLFEAGEGVDVRRVLDILTAYEETPDGDFVFYAYDDPSAAPAGFRRLPDGHAGAPLPAGTSRATKKCRRIFLKGTLCNAMTYRSAVSDDGIHAAMAVGLRPVPASDPPGLEEHPDNAALEYVGGYAVARRGSIFLAYFTGVQVVPEDPGFHGLIASSNNAERRAIMRLLSQGLGARDLLAE